MVLETPTHHEVVMTIAAWALRRQLEAEILEAGKARVLAALLSEKLDAVEARCAALEQERDKWKAHVIALGEDRDFEHAKAKAAEAQSAALRHGLEQARAVMIRAMDALESDTELDARREAFELIQEQFEGVSIEDHQRAAALITGLQQKNRDERAHEIALLAAQREPEQTTP